jgi:peptidyl-prolyl cis-trans isomerase D
VAFSESMIEDGTVSDPIDVGNGHSVLIRVASHAQAHQLPLAEVSQKVVAAIRGDRAAKAATAAANRLVAAVRGGTSLKDAAAVQQLPVSEVSGLTRNMPMPDPVAVEAMFKALPPSGGKASAGQVALPDGRVVVFAISRIIPGDPAEASVAEKQSYQQQLEDMAGQDDLRALVDSLRKRIKVTVAEDRL